MKIIDNPTYFKKAAIYWSSEENLEKTKWYKNQLASHPILSEWRHRIDTQRSVELVYTEVVMQLLSRDEFEAMNERLKKAWTQHKSRLKKNESEQKAFTAYLPKSTLRKLKEIAQTERKQISLVVDELIIGRYAKLKKAGKLKEPHTFNTQSDFVKQGLNFESNETIAKN